MARVIDIKKIYEIIDEETVTIYVTPHMTRKFIPDENIGKIKERIKKLYEHESK